jgi:hypothetical protein
MDTALFTDLFLQLQTTDASQYQSPHDTQCFLLKLSSVKPPSFVDIYLDDTTTHVQVVSTNLRIYEHKLNNHRSISQYAF